MRFTQLITPINILSRHPESIARFFQLLIDQNYSYVSHTNFEVGVQINIQTQDTFCLAKN
jgi:hypothetical protein